MSPLHFCKLTTNAGQVIQDEMERDPGAELKQLQTLLYQQCGVSVSLSSISRRLKVLGRSPGLHSGMARRLSRKTSEDNSTALQITHDDRPTQEQHSQGIDKVVDAPKRNGEQARQADRGDLSQHRHEQQYDNITHLEDFSTDGDTAAMQRAFAANLRKYDLESYTADMNLDMLDLPAGFEDLEHGSLVDNSHTDRMSDHVYDYSAFHDDDSHEHDEPERNDDKLSEYSRAMSNSDLYQHSDARQLLFDDADLNGGGWHGVLTSPPTT